MNTQLRSGQILTAYGSNLPVRVGALLGEGGQAEVYHARVSNSDHALKWYRREYLSADARLWERLRNAISAGAPSEQFLWPFDLVATSGGECGGYLMPLKPEGFVSMVEVMRRTVEPTFRTLTWVGFLLAHSFLKLHAAGLCYRDINFGNVFLNPENGDVRIADTDNVDINLRTGGIRGTPGFMAPEVVRNETHPNSATDRFSLAVLLFYLFMLGHPLKGKRELKLGYQASDPDGSYRLCAEHPVFIFDPQDDSNRPEPGLHDAPLNFWSIYPESLRRLFIRAFTEGVRDPEARIMENEWRKELSCLRDSLMLCKRCGAENFFDPERVRQRRELAPCWSCEQNMPYPSRLRVGLGYDSRVVVLSPGTQLFPHHLEGDTYNYTRVLAEVGSKGNLRNLSGRTWTYEIGNADRGQVPPGGTLAVIAGCRIDMGTMQTELRI